MFKAYTSMWKLVDMLNVNLLKFGHLMSVLNVYILVFRRLVCLWNVYMLVFRHLVSVESVYIYIYVLEFGQHFSPLQVTPMVRSLLMLPVCSHTRRWRCVTGEGTTNVLALATLFVYTTDVKCIKIFFFIFGTGTNFSSFYRGLLVLLLIQTASC